MTTTVKRQRLHVVYDKDWKLWLVTQDGISYGGKFATKVAAVAEGRRLARGREPSQLIVHKMNGEIQIEFTYPRSSDPERYPG